MELAAFLQHACMRYKINVRGIPSGDAKVQGVCTV